MKLNLGAGDKPIAGWTNVDLYDFDATDTWPYPSGFIEAVNADCLLPHIPPGESGKTDPLDRLLMECARCLKPNGVFTFSAPDWRDPSNALGDLYHYRLISPRTFWHFWNEETNRPLEARGNFFMKPSWKVRRIQEQIEGESRFLPGLLRMGTSDLGVLTHLAFRFNARWALKSGRLDWTMKRNGRKWG